MHPKSLLSLACKQSSWGGLRSKRIAWLSYCKQPKGISQSKLISISHFWMELPMSVWAKKSWLHYKSQHVCQMLSEDEVISFGSVGVGADLHSARWSRNKPGIKGLPACRRALGAWSRRQQSERVLCIPSDRGLAVYPRPRPPKSQFLTALLRLCKAYLVKDQKQSTAV